LDGLIDTSYHSFHKSPILNSNCPVSRAAHRQPQAQQKRLIETKRQKRKRKKKKRQSDNDKRKIGFWFLFFDEYLKIELKQDVDN
jgi:hypothetical protein